VLDLVVLGHCVYSYNTDVDLVNELAQYKRLDAGELGERAIRAVDRDYLLRPGDVVAVRNAAYTFGAQPGQPRPKRIENGQTAIVESIDPDRDTLTLLLREPGAEPRLVHIDQARLRAEHAAGQRAAAIRLHYALHSFPAQGATVRGTATLAGHWSQAKQEAYVGDTRAIYRHSVHVAREDLGADGIDEDRLGRYAQRISNDRQRQASIRRALDGTRQLGVELPENRPLPGVENPLTALLPGDRLPEALRSTRDRSTLARTGEEQSQEPRGQTSRLEWALSAPLEDMVRALGPVPEERIARERWEREARRLEGLRLDCNTEQPTSSPKPGSPALRPSQSLPPRPAARSPERDSPTIQQ
jgi:hypothetical protein